MKKCTRCKGDFRISMFQIINRKTGKRASMCPNCKREYDREYWAKTKERRGVRKRENGNAIRNRNRQFILDYLRERRCIDCGEGDTIVLEFDHVGSKSFNISDGIRSSCSIARLKDEISKCEVVCANCHRRRTSKQFGYFKQKKY